MASKAVRALLVAFAALVLTAGAVMPAMAQESPELIIKNTGEVSAQARHFNEVETPQTLYQCPALFCNKGEVLPGQALGEICIMDAEGYGWALVYNRANGHTGFVNRLRLKHPDPQIQCKDVGQYGYVVQDATLYQCPATHCNKGVAEAYDHLRVECYIDVNDGWYWIWVYNASNHHEGLLREPTNHGLERC
ncbi:hypothetical protein SAMN04488074_13533 [Lentzea albidocapillata subsp. violacea]|uniref:SH3 domain-containing protein n=1 Tax=Lentzea albidocapillata subsp. violacea TaxID=128104 RepID=A0A1G9YUJ6_9PSEU|nr:hypothetical protein [Lentzea albidocapillata]SDN12355.1 hypothetical protein SAMN04488074_13533 [Lentzea albidocapillata subsp. violacea]